MFRYKEAICLMLWNKHKNLNGNLDQFNLNRGVITAKISMEISSRKWVLYCKGPNDWYNAGQCKGPAKCQFNAGVDATDPPKLPETSTEELIGSAQSSPPPHLVNCGTYRKDQGNRAGDVSFQDSRSNPFQNSSP